MLIAHLPAAWLLTRRLRGDNRFRWLGLVAGVLPDLDMVRFYLVDDRQFVHHSYWTHLPYCWAMLAAAWFIVAAARRSTAARAAGTFFFANILLHLLLDTVVGKICWLAPFEDRGFALFAVPSGHSFWVANFVLHWSFVFELAIVLWAAWEFATRRRSAWPAPC